MLSIGDLQLPLPVVQAALSGYSDWPMRAVARRLGAPYTVCEVMIDSFVNSLKDREKTKRFLMVEDEDHPAGAQLMGADPDQFTAAARRLVESGFDVIDINFGCPVKKVLGRCRGGFHLSQPDIAIQIIKQVRDAVPDRIPLTVKMRRGIDDSDASRDSFYRILEAGFEAGIAAVTVHGRTVEQRYNGPSRWSFLKQLVSDFPNRTILGSGDLFSAADCVRMLEETGVSGVTAARGSIGNPWIFAQARALLDGARPLDAPDVAEQRRVMEMHLDFACRVYSEKQAVRQMRKFSLRYCDWHPQGDNVRADFISIGDKPTWQQVVEKWYSDNRPGVYPETPGRPRPPAKRSKSGLNGSVSAG